MSFHLSENVDRQTELINFVRVQQMYQKDCLHRPLCVAAAVLS